jgi:PD-(D/E)XK nuclease superfamily
MPKEFYLPERDGVTQSLLKTFISCRKMAELSLNGWTTNRQSYALTYGTIIHAVLEIVYDGIRQKKIMAIPSEKSIQKITSGVELQWRKENPTKDPKTLMMLEECLTIAEATLPEYFKFWWKMDFKKIQWRNLEQSFKIPYTTSKGDKTFIRGKKDGVYGIKSIKLFETKTKSQVNLDDLIDTLWFEFQVNLYIWAIKKTYKQVPAGINYNILRKTSLTRHVSESLSEFGNRIRQDIKKRPEFYFIRLDITVQDRDMKIFEIELEKIVQEFIDWRKGKLATYRNTSECITKYGRCSYLNICSKGDYTGHYKRKMVFKELEDM